MNEEILKQTMREAAENLSAIKWRRISSYCPGS